MQGTCFVLAGYAAALIQSFRFCARMKLVTGFDRAHIAELGGGRNPLFSPFQAPEMHPWTHDFPSTTSQTDTKLKLVSGKKGVTRMNFPVSSICFAVPLQQLELANPASNSYESPIMSFEDSHHDDLHLPVNDHHHIDFMLQYPKPYASVSVSTTPPHIFSPNRAPFTSVPRSDRVQPTIDAALEPWGTTQSTEAKPKFGQQPNLLDMFYTSSNPVNELAIPVDTSVPVAAEIKQSQRQARYHVLAESVGFTPTNPCVYYSAKFIYF